MSAITAMDNVAPRSRMVVRGERLYERLLMVGLGLLFAPWAVRTLETFVPALSLIKVTHVKFIAAVLLAVATLWGAYRGRCSPRYLLAPARLWYFVLIAWIGVLLMEGLLLGNPKLVILQELITLTVFCSGFLLGISRNNWEVIDRVYLRGLVYVGVPIVMFGIIEAATFNSALLRRSLAYTASSMLAPATFYVMMLERPRMRAASLHGIVAILGYTISQILFAKRGPFLRIAVAVYMGVIGLPMLLGRTRFRSWAALAAGVMLAVLIGSATERGQEAWGDLARRFQGFNAISASVFGTDDAYGLTPLHREKEMFRLTEVQIFVDNMEPIQLATGLGLGGYVIDARLKKWSVMSFGNRRLEGKSSLHIGMFWSLIKGGVLFFIFFHAGVLYVLLRLRSFMSRPLALHCWGFVLLNLVFSAAEGIWMQPGLELTTFLVAACMGLCSSSRAYLDEPGPA